MSKRVTSLKIEDKIYKKFKKKAIDKDKEIGSCLEEAMILWIES